MAKILFSLIAFVLLSIQLQAQDMYRVKADKLNVRSTNDPKSKVIGSIKQDENVAVLDSSDAKYFKIKVTNGEGWVSKDFLVRVSPPLKPAVAKTAVNVEVQQVEHDYSSIIFFVVVAVILFLILFLVFKYTHQSKILIGILTVVILTTAYFCYITFVMKKTVAGTFSSDSETQYQSFDFSTKDSVIVKDIYADSTFTSKYTIDGDMIKLYDQQNTILLLIRDENTLIGEGFTKGTFKKK